MAEVETEDEEQEYETTQTVIAAYLVYMGQDMDLEWEHGICTYYFAKTKETKELLMKLAAGEALVEPQAFNNTFMQVRNQMFQARDKAQKRGKA